MAKTNINIVCDGQKRTFGSLAYFDWWVDLRERFLNSDDMRHHRDKDRLVQELNRVKASVLHLGKECTNGKS